MFLEDEIVFPNFPVKVIMPRAPLRPYTAMDDYTAYLWYDVWSLDVDEGETAEEYAKNVCFEDL